MRHGLDARGYPLHIALVEKLFAASYQIEISASNNGDIWAFDYGSAVPNERPTTRATRSAFKAWGLFHGDAIPFDQASQPDYKTAFDFAKGAMGSIQNMPESQKSLANYGVLFIDSGNMIWVEFGPRFAPDEAPHLGCQTQLGRDMVFGFNKKKSENQETSGIFLQCF